MTYPDQSENPHVSEQYEISADHIAESSAGPSIEGSKSQKGKHKVQWRRAEDSQNSDNEAILLELPSDKSSEEKDQTSLPTGEQIIPRRRRSDSAMALLRASGSKGSRTASAGPNMRAKPPILKKTSGKSQTAAGHDGEDDGEKPTGIVEENHQEGAVTAHADKAISQQSALKRAQSLERSIGMHSAPATQSTSQTRGASRIPMNSPPKTPPPLPLLNPNHPNLDLGGFPLEKLKSRRRYGPDEDESDEETDKSKDGDLAKRKIKKQFHTAAKQLFRHHTRRDPNSGVQLQSKVLALKSSPSTPIVERDPHDYVPSPKQYPEGVIGSFMRLYNEQGLGSALAGSSGSQPLLGSGSSGTSSPGASMKGKSRKWYRNPTPNSSGSITGLVSSSTSLAQPVGSQLASPLRPEPKRKSSSVQNAKVEAIRIRMHVADVLQRKAYLLIICRALMTYGAPTHRLEEYMRMSARVLEIDSSFYYLPGCMIVSFGEEAWQTTDVRIVRCTQRVNLSKLYDAHAVYKEVVHDIIGVGDAIDRLESLNSSGERYGVWLLVPLYGVASVCVGPFAFAARPVDLPIIFILGCLLGFMQLVLAPRSDLYSNVFEVSAAVVTSFLSRAFGSIHHGKTFCFSALAQSSIALILPGYTVLCGSLELQSKNLVAGSVRMVYAIIYSHFLGYGIAVGTALYGVIDPHATSDTTCNTPWPFWWQFIFVAPFTLCLIIINQGNLTRMPPMLGLALVGYVVNYFSAKRFASNAQIAQGLGALAIGVLANLWSRLRHGLAAALLLPAIFVQVPSGLAASGSLVSGVISADQTTNRTGTLSDGVTTVSNGSQASIGDSAAEVNSAVLNVGYSMIQIATGITVGLFISALVVYPVGKRRSGLFSF